MKNRKQSNNTKRPRICKSDKRKKKHYKDRKDTLSISEIITIIILSQLNQSKDFKSFYNGNMKEMLLEYFPKMPSYSGFSKLKKKVDSPLKKFIQHLFGKKTGVYYIDSTPLAVCKNQRIHRHKTFKDLAERGKSSMGWFYGFKVHFIINDNGEIVSFRITKGNVHDIEPIIELTERLKDKGGKLIGDRGYICGEEKQNKLKNKCNMELITKSRKNMKNKQYDTLSEEDRKLLGKRNIVETVIGEIKRLTNITTTRIKNKTNYFVNILSSIAAYQLKIKLKLS